MYERVNLTVCYSYNSIRYYIKMPFLYKLIAKQKKVYPLNTLQTFTEKSTCHISERYCKPAKDATKRRIEVFGLCGTL